MDRYTFRPQYHRSDDFDYIQYIKSQYGKDNSAEHAKLIKCMKEAINAELTMRQKRILYMYYAQNMKQHEIAESLGIAKSTVCRSLARSRNKLQKCLRYFDIDHLAA